MNSQTWPIQTINIVSDLTDLVFSDKRFPGTPWEEPKGLFFLFPLTSSRDAEVMEAPLRQICVTYK